MKLAAPTDLLELLARCGVACPAEWPEAEADCGRDGLDVEVALEGCCSRTVDLLPLPYVLAAVAGALSAWAGEEAVHAGEAERPVQLSGSAGEGEVMALADLLDVSTAVDAVRRHAPPQDGEWSCTATAARHAPVAVEWRRGGWALRFDQRDSAGIEVQLPLRACRGTGSGHPGGRRRLSQRVERLENLPGALLVHLSPARAGAQPLASPLRLPRVFEVHTLSRQHVAAPAAAAG